MKEPESNAWSPYLAGALTGLLMVIAAAFTGRFFGASSSFSRTAAMLEQPFSPSHVAGNEYFRMFPPSVDWQWMFVLGICIGAFMSAYTSGSFKLQAVPPMWEARFGPGRPKRWAVAFAGGAIAMFGARMAGGCPSGHGLGGISQLALSGLVALACFYLGGVVSANILYRWLYRGKRGG